MKIDETRADQLIIGNVYRLIYTSFTPEIESDIIATLIAIYPSTYGFDNEIFELLINGKIELYFTGFIRLKSV